MRSIKHIFIFSFFISSLCVEAQINSGRVVYERKTNLHKSLKTWDDVKEWIKEVDKIKIEEFELFFNDSLCSFKPIEVDTRESFDWATSKNITFQNKSTNTKITFKKIWGEEFVLKDTLSLRKWQIVDGQRNIAGYICRKAIWKENDSTRIYAWYTDEIHPSFGPESFNGLPGLILGLATEDGGIIYFAKKVEIIKPKLEDLVVPKTKKKIINTGEFKQQLTKDFSKNKWGKAMIINNFGGIN